MKKTFVRQQTTTALISSALVSCLLLAGCGSSATDSNPGSTTSSASAVTPAGNPAAASTACTTCTATATTTAARLSQAEITSLTFMREEEKLARDVYLRLYERWGLRIFQTIALNSEQQHMDMMQALLQAYALPDPVVDNRVGAFTDPLLLGLYQDLMMRGNTSVVEALRVGAFIEETDLQDLQEGLTEVRANSNDARIINTYNNLMCASRNHLRAFVGQLTQQGVSYVAQALPPAEVAAIVGSPIERCGP